MSRVAVVGAGGGAAAAEATSAVRPAMASVFICIGFLPVVRACEIISPHPEERRFLAARLEGWPRARPCLLPSFETAAQEGGLLRMRAFNFLTCSFAGHDNTALCPQFVPIRPFGV